MVAQRQKLSKRKTERPKCINNVCRREVSSCTKSCRSSSRSTFISDQRVFLPFPLVVELPVGPVLWCESIPLYRWPKTYCVGSDWQPTSLGLCSRRSPSPSSTSLFGSSPWLDQSSPPSLRSLHFS